MPRPSVTFEETHDGWRIKVHGSYIVDASTGNIEIFQPPHTVTSAKELEAWRRQIIRSVSRMSGQIIEQPEKDGDK